MYMILDNLTILLLLLLVIFVRMRLTNPHWSIPPSIKVRVPVSLLFFFFNFRNNIKFQLGKFGDAENLLAPVAHRNLFTTKGLPCSLWTIGEIMHYSLHRKVASDSPGRRTRENWVYSLFDPPATLHTFRLVAFTASWRAIICKLRLDLNRAPEVAIYSFLFVCFAGTL